jgi:phosphoglycolate phosphatase
MTHRLYDLAIFDFDGTLADSADWVISIFNSVADRYGFRKVDDEEIAMLRGRGTREIIAYLGVPMWRLPAIAKHMRELSAAAADQIPLFDGVDRLLAGIADQGMTLAVVSSNGEATIRQVLGPANAARIAHYDCGASLFGKGAKFQRVARLAGAARDRVVCIGDETRDIEAAAKAGMASAAVTWGYATADILARSRPTHTAASVDELLAILGSPNIEHS